MSASASSEAQGPDARWILGAIGTAAGTIPVVDTNLRFSDRLGSWKVRWGIKRMRFRVQPGLYAVGQPTDSSPVFVSANFKMSFDRLRSQLGRIDSWILVLDTKGVNVWCAAGKGTFGTDEIVRQVQSVRLQEVVSHRRLIIPQLGAPGVAAHEVSKRCGFGVLYGPVRAQDIPAFLDAGMKASREMRLVRFSFRDRVVLIPNDLVGYARYALLVAVSFFVLSGFGSGVYSLDRVVSYGATAALLILIIYVAAVTLPLPLLPWLPGRPFSVKGLWIGLAMVLAVVWYATRHPDAFPGPLAVGAWICIAPAMASFIALNYTGSSTYTSLSGVKKEVRVAVPIQIAVAVLGTGLWFAGLWV